MRRWTTLLRLVLLGLAAIAFPAIVLTAAVAEDYPSKPVKVIVPLTPGSPVDVLARVVMQHLAARIGQIIIVENRPGAGTTLGNKVVATAEPDGYTLLVAASSFAISASMYPHAGYDSGKDFAAVASLVTTPQILVVAPSVPAKSVSEFVAYAKANPGKLNFGFGLGTLPHFLGESFKAITKTDIASIPYKGGAQAITDMLGGRIQMNFGTSATLLPLIKQGKIRPLAVTSETRSRLLPDVPTMKESGLPQLSLGFWAGILAPKGTPTAVVHKLNTDINAVLKTSELAVSMARLGFEPKTETAPEFTAFVASEIARWRPVVEASGLKPK